ALRLEAVRGERGIAWHVRKCRGGPVPSAPFVPEPDSIFIGVPPVAPFPAREPSAPSPASGGRSQGDACVVAPSPVRGGGPGWGPAAAFGPGPRCHLHRRAARGSFSRPRAICSLPRKGGKGSRRRVRCCPPPRARGRAGVGATPRRGLARLRRAPIRFKRQCA